MPRHLGLQRRSFLTGLPQQLLYRYLEQMQVRNIERDWLHLNYDRFDDYLDDEANAEQAAIILEDLQRINDICEQSLGLLIRAYQKYLIPYDDALPISQLAMELFLDHPDAFDFAWSLFLLCARAPRLGLHRIAAEGVRVGADQQEAFRRDLGSWFAEQARGRQCQVQFYEERGDVAVMIRHGAHVRAVPFWDGPQISTTSYRPAIEDVLLFEPDTRVLRIKSSLARDRDQYLRLWCRHMAGNEDLADDAHRTSMFTLAPIRDGSFSYAGTDAIVRVELRRVKLRLTGVSGATVEVQADDVLEAFRYDTAGLGLQSGKLVAARFRFLIRSQGRKLDRVTFTVEPPLHSTLPERRHADVIMKYLAEQGVYLN